MPEIQAETRSAKFIGKVTGAEYELIKHLGDGTFGTVFKAVRRSPQQGAIHGAPQPEEKVAIKFIPLDARPEHLTMVQREVAIINHVAHSHIVPVRDVFEVAQRSQLPAGLPIPPPPTGLPIPPPPTPAIGLVMELANCSLQNYLDKHPKLPEGAIRWLFQQLMLAVRYCHTKQVVQRDIKPGNILLFQRKQSNINLKLADFGWAKRFDLSDPDTRPAGTRVYAAPELRKDAGEGTYEPGPVDMWSCGVVLFRMLLPEEYKKALNRAERDGGGITDWLSNIPRLTSGAPANQAFDLLDRMLQVETAQRATLEYVLVHPWFTKDLPPGAMEGNQCRTEINEEWLDLWLVDVIKRQTGVQLKCRRARPACN